METSKNKIDAETFENLCCNLDQLEEGEKVKYAQLVEPLRYFLGTEKFQSCFDGAAKCLEVINRVAVNTVTVVNDEFTPIGYGIYPEASLVNHSCEPNAVFVFRNKQLLLRTLRPIAINEEVFVSYTDQLAPKEERRQILKQQFNFICQCNECVNEIREQLFHKKKFGTESLKIGEISLTASGFPEVSVLPDSTESDFSKILEGVKNMNTDDCFDKLEKLGSKYFDTNLLVHELLVKCANIASQKSFKSALQFDLRLLDNFQKFYPDYHPMKSLQYTRVSKIFSFLGKVRSSVEYYEKALRNIAVTHGCESELYKVISEQFNLDQREIAHFEEQSLRKTALTQK